jgi:hypothetical protein
VQAAPERPVTAKAPPTATKPNEDEDLSNTCKLPSILLANARSLALKTGSLNGYLEVSGANIAFVTKLGSTTKTAR